MQASCQVRKHEGCASLPPPPNSLELFTLFSLPFLHFYNFLGLRLSGVEGGVWCCQAPPSVLLAENQYEHSAPFSPSSATPRRPPFPGLLWRVELESSSF